MKEFKVKQNKILEQEINGYYNCDYVGYQKQGNPDFINRLKNMSKQYTELDLVDDFIEVTERFSKDIEAIIKRENKYNYTVCVIPRSKTDKSYSQSQLMFKKAISSIANKLQLKDATNAISRTRNTKTTHNWRLENNNGDMPYKGITKDTCTIDENAIKGKDIILVDDIYTEDVNIAEDCIQTLLDIGAKSVKLYVIAKTKG